MKKRNKRLSNRKELKGNSGKKEVSEWKKGVEFGRLIDETSQSPVRSYKKSPARKVTIQEIMSE